MEDVLKNQRFEEIELVDPHSEKKEGFIRFVCISDTHSAEQQIEFMPKGDVLLHAGDFTTIGLEHEIQNFNDWLKELPYQYKVVIAGNHDIPFDVENYKSKYRKFHWTSGVEEPYDAQQVKGLLKDCIYLEDEATTVMGYKIYGTPWQPEYHDWAFNLPRDESLQNIWKAIPSDTEILLTHAPPFGRGDELKDGFRTGCDYLLDEVQNRIKPLYHVFGHIHEGYGISYDGTTKYFNASTCTFRYKPTNPPLVFDLPIKN